MPALYALAIFLSFAIIGGLIVRALVRHEAEHRDEHLPPRGVPRDQSDDLD